MTLVRVAWGAVTAVWALSLLPDIDPFFTEGALLYERDLRDGSWNLLPHLGGAGGARHLRRAAPRVAGARWWGSRPGSAPPSPCCASWCCSAATAPSSTPATCSCGWSGSPSCCRRAACCGPWTRPSTGAGAASARSFGRRSGCGCCSSSWRWATCSRRGRRRAGRPGRTAPRIALVAAHRGPAALRGPRLVVRPGARCCNLLTWATLAFEATFIVLVWPRRLRLWVLGGRGAPPPRHRRLPRHRLLQPGRLPGLPGLPPRRARRAGRAPVRRSAVSAPAAGERRPTLLDRASPGARPPLGDRAGADGRRRS